MAAEKKIIIHDYSVDQNTGRIELHLKCQTTDGSATWDGPVRQYSCDPQILRDRFNGNIEEFEAWAASEHSVNVGVHPELPAKLESRKGAVIG